MLRKVLGICLLTALLSSLTAIEAYAGDAKPKARTFVGTLDVIQAEDPARGIDEIFYTLHDAVTRRAYKVRFKGDPKGRFSSGDVVSITGVEQGGELSVEEADTSVAKVLAASDAMSMNERRAVVLLVNFADKATSLTRSAVGQTMFADPVTAPTAKSVNGMYQDSSFGQVGWPGDTDGDGALDVFGPFTINYLSTSACDYNAWGYAAEDEAAAAGVNLNLYQHIVFVMPGNSCGYAGIANVGCGSVCRAWIFTGATDAIAHELGHNLGMRHASTDTNNDGAVESTYGDNSDIMGYSGVGWRQVNAPHKEQMGWFGAYPGAIQTTTQSGRYVLSPLEMDPSQAPAPQILKIRKLNSTEYYYFSYRIPMGYDTSLRTTYIGGCNIHRFASGGSGTTSFIKMLADGGTFSDASSGLTVQQIGHSTDPAAPYVELQVTIQAARLAPSITVSPTTQSTNQSGKCLTYTVSVKNNDTGGAATGFSVSATAPTGWTATSTPALLSLAPGATGAVSVAVTPPLTATTAKYSLAIKAVEAAHPTASCTATYVLDTAAPAAITNLSARKKGKVQLTWTAPSDGTGSGVAKYQVFRTMNGSGYLLCATVTSAGYQDSPSSTTNLSYYVKAVDAAGNVSAQSNIATLAASRGKTRK